MTSEGADASEDGTGRGTPIVNVDLADYAPDVYQCHGSNVGPMGALRRGNGAVTGGVPFIADTPFAFHENSRAELRVTDIAGNLSTGGGKPGQGYPAIHDGIGVRRLTPKECERLQGFPDDWNATGINDKGAEVPISDAQRYRQLGNSIAIPIFEDIAHRLVDADERYP